MIETAIQGKSLNKQALNDEACNANYLNSFPLIDMQTIPRGLGEEAIQAKSLNKQALNDETCRANFEWFFIKMQKNILAQAQWPQRRSPRSQELQMKAFNDEVCKANS